MTGSGHGIEWVFLAVGGVLTLFVLGLFVFLLTRKDGED